MTVDTYIIKPTKKKKEYFISKHFHLQTSKHLNVSHNEQGKILLFIEGICNKECSEYLAEKYISWKRRGRPYTALFS